MTDVIEIINPEKLMIGENSRWRADSNLSELMESIKQIGILQPITARREDNVVICGNRRLAAALKLGIQKVPVIFKSDISDKQLLILNLVENIQREDISSIEIGKICYEMMKNSEFNMSLSELATATGKPINRIKVCLDAFLHLPEKFRGQVRHLGSSRDRKYGELPDSIVRAILNFSREYKKINAEEMELLLNTAAEEKLTNSQIVVIGRLFDKGMTLRQAIKDSNAFVICRLDFVVVKNELITEMKKARTATRGEFFRNIVKEKYSSLIF